MCVWRMSLGLCVCVQCVFGMWMSMAVDGCNCDDIGTMGMGSGFVWVGVGCVFVMWVAWV